MTKWIFPGLALAVGFFGAREWSESALTVVDQVSDSGMREDRATWHSGRRAEVAGFAGRMREIERGGIAEEDWGKFFKEWFREDPEGALDAMRNSKLGLGGRKPFFLLGFLFEEDAKGLEAMGRYLDEIISSGHWHEGGFDGEVHREFDFRGGGKELVDKVTGLPGSPMKKELWKYAMAGWFYADWQGAGAYVGGLPEEERREAERAFLSERLPRWVSREADGREWIEEILGAEGNRDLLTWHGPKLVAVMAKDDPKRAFEWAGEHLSGLTLAKAISGTVEDLMYQDGGTEEAGEIVDDLLPGGVREQAARALVLGTARKDPLAAFDRARAEEDHGMEMGVQTWLSLGRTLGRQSPEEARRILESSVELERVFESNAMEQAFWKEPEESKQWAEAMEGPKREQVIELVFRAWHLREQEEAKAWRDGLNR